MPLVVKGRVSGGNAALGKGTRLGGMDGKLIRQIRWEKGGSEKLMEGDSKWVWVRAPSKNIK